MSQGETLGVFQLEGAGMRSLLRLMRPDHFEDISAVGALYRPVHRWGRILILIMLCVKWFAKDKAYSSRARGTFGRYFGWYLRFDCLSGTGYGYCSKIGRLFF